MIQRLDKYIGCVVEIIYIDRNGNMTHRTVKVWMIQGNTLKTFCFHQRAPRTFKVQNILALLPLVGKCTG